MVAEVKEEVSEDILDEIMEERMVQVILQVVAITKHAMNIYVDDVIASMLIAQVYTEMAEKKVRQMQVNQCTLVVLVIEVCHHLPLTTSETVF